MEIRLMTIEDYDRVYSLWLSCRGMGLNDLDDSRQGIAAYLRRNPNTCFVAQSGSDLVGAILSGHDGRRGYIYHTAVHPDHRHRGIARTLVNHAVSALKNEGIHKVALVVFSNNQQGNAFWESMDFTTRTDLTYRNKALDNINRIDT